MTVKAAAQVTVHGLITDEALPAWQRLMAVLDGVSPPCASDSEAWFDATDPEPAIAACGWCNAPVECLAFAVASGEKHGVWGGRSFPLAKRGKS